MKINPELCIITNPNNFTNTRAQSMSTTQSPIWTLKKIMIKEVNPAGLKIILV